MSYIVKNEMKAERARMKEALEAILESVTRPEHLAELTTEGQAVWWAATAELCRKGLGQ